jgi:mono/diheme cytochrome c family protein
MRRGQCAKSLTLVMTVVAISTSGCGQPSAPEPAAAPPAAANVPAPASAPAQTPVERGKYLVTLGGCHDCHSPKVFQSGQPEPDPARLLSGHPANEKIPPVPAGVITPTGWAALTGSHFTVWAGPWGVSFTANLTPDQATGLGSWTEEMFMKAIRTGKHQGEGRAILPPMPWPMYRQMTDDDLKAIFAYLRSLPPIKNPVPEPVPPAAK